MIGTATTTLTHEDRGNQRQTRFYVDPELKDWADAIADRRTDAGTVITYDGDQLPIGAAQRRSIVLNEALRLGLAELDPGLLDHPNP